MDVTEAVMNWLEAFGLVAVLSLSVVGVALAAVAVWRAIR